MLSNVSECWNGFLRRLGIRDSQVRDPTHTWKRRNRGVAAGWEVTVWNEEVQKHGKAWRRYPTASRARPPRRARVNTVAQPARVPADTTHSQRVLPSHFKMPAQRLNFNAPLQASEAHHQTAIATPHTPARCTNSPPRPIAPRRHPPAPRPSPPLGADLPAEPLSTDGSFESVDLQSEAPPQSRRGGAADRGRNRLPFTRLRTREPNRALTPKARRADEAAPAVSPCRSDGHTSWREEPTPSLIGADETDLKRAALVECQEQLTQLDDEVVALYERYDSSLVAIERCERAAARHLEKARAWSAEALAHKQLAEETYIAIHHRLTGAVHEVHRSFAPFVEHAPPHKTWLRRRSAWVEVHLSLRDSHLSLMPSRSRRLLRWHQNLPLRVMVAVRAHGSLAVWEGCCSTRTRFEWTIQLEAGWGSGRSRGRYNESCLTFCSETSQAMEYWVNHILKARAMIGLAPLAERWAGQGPLHTASIVSVSVDCRRLPLGVHVSDGVVTHVSPGGAAAGAIHVGDTLLSVDGHPVDDDGSNLVIGPSAQHTFVVRRGLLEPALGDARGARAGGGSFGGTAGRHRRALYRSGADVTRANDGVCSHSSGSQTQDKHVRKVTTPPPPHDDDETPPHDGGERTTVLLSRLCWAPPRLLANAA
ncbi:hypothetical protein AB1Y20_017228 [Prymnesium parvum]|uniref:PDZ domain-containing protein n=1 Tax=Prymnesium parvum TaxID=97485 RepID=A0AB34IB76_PRYPA